MIAVFVILCLFLYFFIRTYRETKTQVQKWECISDIPEESRIIGTVTSIDRSTERFFLNYRVVSYTVLILSDGKKIKAQKKMPIKGDIPTIDISERSKVLILGRWNSDIFLINRIVNLKGS